MEGKEKRETLLLAENQKTMLKEYALAAELWTSSVCKICDQTSESVVFLHLAHAGKSTVWRILDGIIAPLVISVGTSSTSGGVMRNCFVGTYLLSVYITGISMSC